jgi:hypothetical protein
MKMTEMKSNNSMLHKKALINSVFKEFKELVNETFPKHCACCGRDYMDLKEFLEGTEELPSAVSMIQSLGGADNSVTDILRNCACGTTLMAVFNERRDMSESGANAREKFAQLLTILTSSGLDITVARRELLKMLHGEDSEYIKNITRS